MVGRLRERKRAREATASGEFQIEKWLKKESTRTQTKKSSHNCSAKLIVFRWSSDEVATLLARLSAVFVDTIKSFIWPVRGGLPNTSSTRANFKLWRYFHILQPANQQQHYIISHFVRDPRSHGGSIARTIWRLSNFCVSRDSLRFIVLKFMSFKLSQFELLSCVVGQFSLLLLLRCFSLLWIRVRRVLGNWVVSESEADTRLTCAAITSTSHVFSSVGSVLSFLESKQLVDYKSKVHLKTKMNTTKRFVISEWILVIYLVELRKKAIYDMVCDFDLIGGAIKSEQHRRNRKNKSEELKSQSNVWVEKFIEPDHQMKIASC